MTDQQHGLSKAYEAVDHQSLIVNRLFEDMPKPSPAEMVAQAQVTATLAVAHALLGVGAAIEKAGAMPELDLSAPLDGVPDSDSVTGWAPGKSPRSVFGDEH